MEDRLERLLALAGVVAVALWVAGILVLEGIAGAVPEDGEEILAYYRDNENAVLTGSWIFMVGSLFFLMFAGALRARLLRAEAPPATIGTLAFAGAVATTVFSIGIPGGGIAAALAIDELSAPAAEALSELTTAFFVGAELSAIVLVVATGVAAWRTAALPRWWGPVSWLLGVWLVIGPIGWAGLLFGVPIWTLATVVFLLQREREPRAGAVVPTG